MSVLTLPRIHFIGVTDWDPSTGNNAPSTYDEATVQPQLGPPDVYYSNFLQWLKQSNGLTGDSEQPNGSWNIYGDHSVHFRQTSVSRAELESGDAPGDDPFLGQPVDILGENYHDPTRPARMVMTDPFTGGEATSQIFYKWLVAGVTEGPDNSKKIGFKATAACRLFSRSPFQTRNLGITFKEGMVGCTWQAAAHAGEIEWFGLDRSPSLRALKAACEAAPNQGLLMRFASYRTLYYQAAYHNGRKINNGRELIAAYADGYTGPNPARSAMLGTFGVWEAGELASAPAGRLLVPMTNAKVLGSSAKTTLGPVVVKIDSSRKMLVADLITAIPELNENLEKADFGSLLLQARGASGNVTPIATLTYDQYSRAAYESSGGVTEFPLSAEAEEACEKGRIEVVQVQRGNPVGVLQQAQFEAETDDWGVYINEGETTPVTIKVTENGGVPATPVRLYLAQYDSNGMLIPETTPMLGLADAEGAPIGPVVPVVDGKVQLGVRSNVPGACFLAFYPFTGSMPPKVPASGFPLPASFYAAVRMLPFDNALERNTPDSMLTWKFVYDNVLRVFDLVYPVMSLVMNLASGKVVEKMAAQVEAATSLSIFESTLAMPITRDLSEGKRRLLHRFLRKVGKG